MTHPVAPPISLHRLLAKFHFGITLFAVAFAGLTVFLTGITALRGYADRNLELAARLGAYSVEPALVFNDPQAAVGAITPLGRVPGIARVQVIDSNGQKLAEWSRPTPDPAPWVTQIFFPEPVESAVKRDGESVGRIRIWGDASALAAYARAGLLGGLACLLLTALATIIIARRFERELTSTLSRIASVARDVRLHRRFERRVAPLPITELDRLGKDVNALLDELSGWHSSIEHEKAELSYRALHDPLTGLPNRAAFDQQMDVALRDAALRNQQFALLFLDVDQFKRTNDLYGHGVGDAVLTAIAARIKGALRPQDFAARIGGDEFAAILTGLDNPDIALQAALRIGQSINEPLTQGESAVIVPSASIGIAIFPGDGKSAADLLNIADLAMYEAKQQHRVHG